MGLCFSDGLVAYNGSLAIGKAVQGVDIRQLNKMADGIADIVENPHNYEFVRGDHSKYLNQDDYTAIIGTSNTMASAGVDPTEHLLEKFVDDSLALGMCIMAENKDTQWAKDIMEAYTSDKAKEAVDPSTGFEALF